MPLQIDFHDQGQRHFRSPSAREADRQQLASDVEAFLNSGNNITKIPTGQSGQTVKAVRKLSFALTAGNKSLTKCFVTVGSSVRASLAEG